jgi:hypothetical protein
LIINRERLGVKEKKDEKIEGKTKFCSLEDHLNSASIDILNCWDSGWPG